MADFERIAAGPDDAPAPESCCSSLLRWFGSFGSSSFTIGSRTLKMGASLGSGGFAYVNQVADVATGEHFAVKRMICQTPEQLKAALDEHRVHERIGSHPCLMPTLGCAQIPSISSAGAEDVLFLLPLARGGALSALIRQHYIAESHLPEQTVLMVLACVASGLAHMHTVGGFCHRDVKPANILLDATPSPSGARLVDYGSTAPAVVRCDTSAQAARLQEAAARHSSMAYRAPELWNPPSPGAVTTKSDVWSLGCTAYAMMYGLSPFESTIVGGVAAGAAPSGTTVGGEGASFAAPRPCTLSRVLGAVRLPREDNDPYTSALRRLVLACLKLEPDERPDAAEVAERARALLVPGGSRACSDAGSSIVAGSRGVGAAAPLRGRAGGEDRGVAVSGEFDDDDDDDDGGGTFNPFAA